MELRTYLSFPREVVASLALILRHSDYQWLLTTNNRHSVSPHKTAKFWNWVWKRVLKYNGVKPKKSFVFWEKSCPRARLKGIRTIPHTFIHTSDVLDEHKWRASLKSILLLYEWFWILTLNQLKIRSSF